jgi:hypothetical protein
MALSALAPQEHADAPFEYFMHAAGPAATPTMRLGWGLTALCVAVVILIGILLAVALARRRPMAAPEALGKEEGGMAWIYIGAGVSTLALLVALFYTLVTLQAVAQPSSVPAMTITVTAYDWWWKIDYDDSAATRHVVTANEIPIPVGVPVRIRLKSADVIHAFCERKFVRDDVGRFCSSRSNQIAKLAVISLYVGLTGRNVLSFHPQLTKIDGKLAFFGQVVLGSRILGDKNAYHTDTASWSNRLDKVVDRRVGDFVSLATALVPNTFTTSVRTFAAGLLQYLIRGRTIAVVDRDGAKLLRECEPIRMRIDDHHFACAF